jgi:hypothetical protein
MRRLSEPKFALPLDEVTSIKEYIKSFIDTHEKIMEEKKN